MGRDHKDVIDPWEGWTFAYLYGIIHSISTRPLRSNYRCRAGEFAYFILSEQIHLARRLHQAYRPGGDRDAYVLSLRDITAGADVASSSDNRH